MESHPHPPHDGTPRMLQDQQEKKLQRFLEDSDRLGRSRKLDMARDAAKMALHGTRWDNGPMVVSYGNQKRYDMEKFVSCSDSSIHTSFTYVFV